MAIQHINYLALSDDLRRLSAEKHKKALRDLLATPLLTDEQKQAIRQKLDHVKKWEKGEVEVEILSEETIPEEVRKAYQDRIAFVAEKSMPPTERNKAMQKRLGKGPKEPKGKDHSVKIHEKVRIKEDVS